MLTERERYELEGIERDLATDVRFAATMRGRRLQAPLQGLPIRVVPLLVVALAATVLCAVLQSAVGVMACAGTSVVLLCVATVVATRARPAGSRT
ncbi:MAG: DUF3040 domain-containing protein [Pseudonocardia sp.]|uniref:DUF3040 domain-containing protein n=1 Tax=unclassified Pseudonocardia TaxID=2619320 RepID=UPI0008697B64|nr:MULTISPECIES: DUF3040 domain-containing protein [unclassified Pseudonocardia]MBN9110855.1 DUF3040 domain-containing protein [Pseudonocardia sp.]ODU26845.1 MAG: hypothetical protein ABS80_05695 [Pseudonocardia sp. SCN 72-51]ODV05434.1 MAG: hypothetical protein ABT15_17280 [Pseudonocardia sp. SCN 73-27]